MKRISRALVIGSTALAFGSGDALAGYPGDITGRWIALLNQTLVTIRITSQIDAGKCKTITGRLAGDDIQGFYCPATGRIFFLRNYPTTGRTSQAYTGNLAENGATNRMGGTFADMSRSGEFAWSASK